MESADEEEDVRKIAEFIDKAKRNDIFQNCFQEEFQDFISFQYRDEGEVTNTGRINDALRESYSLNGTNGDSAIYVPTTALTEDERTVIDYCEDAFLKKILILNRTKNMQLILLHRRIKDLLSDCNLMLKQKNNALRKIEERQSSRNNQLASIWKLAAPYFKDKNFYASPLNEDAAIKRRSNELSIYELTPPPKWNAIEFDNLIAAVKCNYNINKQNVIKQKMRTLRSPSSESDQDENKGDLKQIVALMEELEKLKGINEIPPPGCNKFINWFKVAETFLKDKRTALECESVWNILIHPAINKTEWSTEENKKLEAIVMKHNQQNWDKIALDLNTNRSAFTCCLHYFSKLFDKFKKNKFSPEEDKLLIEVVEMYRNRNYIPWNKVVRHFSRRSRHQLYHRYTYFLSKKDVKRGKFSEAEDILLLILVDRFGRNFKKCEEYMPHRSQVQLKSRYNSNLQRNIKKGCFTEKDDEMLFHYVEKYGTKNWAPLSEKLNRCGAQIRQRYKIIKKFLNDNPGLEISKMPKRKTGWGEKSTDHYTFLKYMAEHFKSMEAIPTLSMIEDSLNEEMKTNVCKTHKKAKAVKHCRTDVNVKNVDSLLTSFFANSINVKQSKSFSVSNTVLNEAAHNAIIILSSFNVNLEIRPEDLEVSPYIDDVDIRILERLSQNKYINVDGVDRLLPPNFCTLVTLRSLLIKHKEYKYVQKHNEAKYNNLIWSMEQHLLKLNEEKQADILIHRTLFSKRFDSLLRWAAILSLEKPFITSSSEIQSERFEVHKVTSEPLTKKIRLDISALKNLSQIDKSTSKKVQFVDRCVVDQLMISNGNLNIIKLSSVTGDDGIIRPVLNNQYSELKVENAQKVDSALKSENNHDTSTWSEYDFLKYREDVELLDEILAYEKIKSDPDVFKL